MKSNLQNKCIGFDFKKLFEKKGYDFFTKGAYNLNIIGIRANTNGIVTNKYDDVLVVDYNTNQGHKRNIYTITTDPGKIYMNNPLQLKGTAILVPGQYRGCYCIDKHNGKYDAICQRLGPVKVYRDGNKDNVYDLNPDTIESGYFGINIHRSNETWIRNTIDNYSAGCQVFNNPKEFKAFMDICKKARNNFGNKFTYTLIEEKDLI